MSLHSLKAKWLLGVLAGALGCELMLLSIRLDEYTFTDMRHLATVIAAIYAGPLSAGLSAVIIAAKQKRKYKSNQTLSAGLSAVIIAAARILLFESSSQAFVAAANMLLIGAVCIAAARTSWSQKKKFWFMNLAGEAIVWWSLSINLQEDANYWGIVLFRLIVAVIGGYLIYHITETVFKVGSAYFENQHKSLTDHLTGLRNRRSFDYELRHLFSVNRKGCIQPFSILMLDIDNFKRFNDQYGHIAGDELLRMIAKCMEDVARSAMNISAYRYGGEEFCMILTGYGHKKAVQVAEEVRQKIAGTPFFLPNGEAVHTTISVGAASYPETAKALEAVIMEADQLLYQAKNSGKNQVR
ncbi:GGDEF domain-containing protein [Bacillus xiapuensis]|uniref:GGDEF domain-containing protein n=1 Tax=Bacillus xiapuensis TaxID=2014075 RepID=UPI001E5EE1C9|nr:GGDEF domain-containing protein [Bacillus xiapuensis]